MITLDTRTPSTTSEVTLLPFLSPKKLSGSIIAKTKPEGGIEEESQEGQPDQGLMSAAEDLISAVNMKDASAVASALRAAFDILDAGPEPMEGEA